MKDADSFAAAHDAERHDNGSAASCGQGLSSPKEMAMIQPPVFRTSQCMEHLTSRRAKRLGPAFSSSMTRRVYPDEESSALV